MSADLQSHDQVPLCVDLDGTLLHTDMLQESLCALARVNPFYFFMIPFWLLRGIGPAKREIAQRVKLNVQNLPFNSAVLDFARKERERGRSVGLVTATDRLIAEPIAAHVGCFDFVLATDGGKNVSGREKARRLAERFPQGFDYIGNAPVDHAVWKSSRVPLVTARSKAFVAGVKKSFPHAVEIANREQSLLSVVRALRVHQWVKNLLLFIPLLMAHAVLNVELLQRTIAGFFAFCFCASGVYILNDLVDLESDRHHATKRRRPFAAGDIAISSGVVLAGLSLCAAVAVAATISSTFLTVLALYFSGTFLYSLVLKRFALIDILILASLYTVRIIAGGVASGVKVSEWLLAFSMFFFLSLAAVKRFSELLSLQRNSGTVAPGRGYASGDMELISQLGSASGYLSVLVLAQYVSNPDVTRLYGHPAVIWGLCPVVLYWIGRIWLLAHRDQLHEDPIVFALRDRVSYLCGVLALLILSFAL